MSDDPGKELPFSGVFAVRDGEVILVDDALEGPNGLAFSPDERFLYVANWDPRAKTVVRYELGSDLRPSAREILCDLTDEPGEDALDGMKVGPDGTLYVCGPGGLWVLSPDGGKRELVRFPEAPHNLAWGDDDGGTLYVTALTSVYRFRP
jgi:gluconolactonase